MGRARLIRNRDRPRDLDAWDDDIPEPNIDAVEALPEWIISRSVPWSRLEHSITDPDVAAVLDAYPWTLLPKHSDWAQVRTMVGNALRKPSRLGPSVGSTHHDSVFTETDVAYLREWYASGFIRVQDVANRYGVSPAAASSMLHGKSWTHVGAADAHRPA